MSECLLITASNSNAAMEAIGNIYGVVSVTYLEHIDVIGVEVNTKEEALKVQEEINKTVPGIKSVDLSGKVYACARPKY
jgi:hypothetical protein